MRSGSRSLSISAGSAQPLEELLLGPLALLEHGREEAGGGGVEAGAGVEGGGLPRGDACRLPRGLPGPQVGGFHLGVLNQRLGRSRRNDLPLIQGQQPVRNGHYQIEEMIG